MVFHPKGWGDKDDELDMDDMADWGDGWDNSNQEPKKTTFSTKKVPNKKKTKSDIIVEDIPANMSALGLNSSFAATKGFLNFQKNI